MGEGTNRGWNSVVYCVWKVRCVERVLGAVALAGVFHWGCFVLFGVVRQGYFLVFQLGDPRRGGCLRLKVRMGRH